MGLGIGAGAETEAAGVNVEEDGQLLAGGWWGRWSVETETEVVVGVEETVCPDDGGGIVVERNLGVDVEVGGAVNGAVAVEFEDAEEIFYQLWRGKRTHLNELGACWLLAAGCW